MNREARIEVTETEDKKTVSLSGEAEADYRTIVFELREITKHALTEQQAESFMYCLLDVFFWHSDDVLELEDRISEMAEIMTMFAEKIKGGVENE